MFNPCFLSQTASYDVERSKGHANAPHVMDTHFETLLIESNGILGRGEQYVTGNCPPCHPTLVQHSFLKLNGI
jgi:hypothetical protein